METDRYKDILEWDAYYREGADELIEEEQYSDGSWPLQSGYDADMPEAALVQHLNLKFQGNRRLDGDDMNYFERMYGLTSCGGTCRYVYVGMQNAWDSTDDEAKRFLLAHADHDDGEDVFHCPVVLEDITIRCIVIGGHLLLDGFVRG